MEKILIGTGALSWHKGERITDRYGFVTLNNEDSDDEKIYNFRKFSVNEVNMCIGRIGKLVCEVLEVRKSTHIGDLSLKIYPSTPTVGEIIELGEGILSYHYDGDDCVGLEPEDGRESFWLDPKQLYKVHEQTVNLYFQPE